MRSSIVVAVLLLAVLGTYANALQVPFLWDDRPLVLVNPDVHRGASFSHYFSRPFWPDPDEARAFFRPVVAISYRLDFLLHGENASGFHLTNLAFHVLNVGLLFALVRRWGTSTYGAALACAAFALLPRLTEAVTWIAGRTDVLAATGVLAALLLWPSASSARPFLRACLAAGALLVGLLCKEVALAGLAAVATFELVQESNRSPAQRALLLAPPIVLTSAFVVLHERVLGGATTGDGLHGIGARAAAAAATWGTYARMIVTPWRPMLQVGLIDVWPPLAIVAGVLVLALVALGFASSLRRRDAPVAAGLALCIVGLALVSHVISIPTNVLACDRFLYLPAAGLALAGAVAAQRLSPRARQMAAAVCAVWILGSTIATFRRNLILADELALWIETAEQVEPNNPLPTLELANVLFRASAWEEALELDLAQIDALEKKGRAASPTGMSALATSATCMSSLGDYTRARVVRKRLVELRPHSWRAWLDLAKVELHNLDLAAARAAALRAEQISEDARDEAIDIMALSFELARPRGARAPDDTGALVDLAKFEDRAGRRLQAERAWVDILRRADVPPATIAEGSAFLARRGSLEAASFGVEKVRAVPELDAVATQIGGVVEERRRLASRINDMRGRLQKCVKRLD